MCTALVKIAHAAIFQEDVVEACWDKRKYSFFQTNTMEREWGIAHVEKDRIDGGDSDNVLFNGDAVLACSGWK